MSALSELEHEASTCRSCALNETRQRVVFSSGPSNASVMVVGEAPGAEEDRTGLPFVGRSGSLLRRLLDEVGLPQESLYVANVVKCRPPANRTPRRAEISACRHFLQGQIKLVAPLVVITLGNTASRTVLETKDPIGQLRGRVHRGHPDVVPTFHPAAALRGGPAVVDSLRSDLALAAALVVSS